MRLLKPQKISERHHTTYTKIHAKSRRPSIKLWQFLHENKYFVGASLILSPLSVLTLLAYNETLHEKDQGSSLPLSLLFIVFADNIHLWCRGRTTAENLSVQLVDTAHLLEKQATEEQNLKMMKATPEARIISFAYAFNLLGNYIMFVLQPFSEDGNLVAPMPYLTRRPIFLWAMYLVQSSVFTAATVCFFSQISYMSEVCLFISTLFDVLAEKFSGLEDRQGFRALMPIHQSAVYFA